MMKTAARWGLMGLGACVATDAMALSCDEVVAQLDAGVRRAVVLRAVAQAGEADPDAFVEGCLAQAAAEEAPRHRYRARTEIDFEGVDVQGELVRPQGQLILERRKASFSEKSLLSRGVSGPAERKRFTDHGTNPTTLVEQDGLSTFAVDVDTASYTVVRRMLAEGHLPPAGAVRAEEFVNWLPYHDAPPPPGGAPLAVHLEAAPHPFAANRHLLRIGLAGRERAGERPPVHLTFLVDTSGSMRSRDKLPLAMRTLHFLVDGLGVEDTVALATYAGSNRRVLEPTPTTRKEVIHAAIDTLEAAGLTAMQSGMELAYQMAAEALLPGAENRVIVLSDGDANIGATSHDQILASIAGWAARGITLTTVGFGTGNYQDTLMEQLANKGDGNCYYVDDFREARRVFGTQLAGTIETIARDVKVQVDFDPQAVRSYRLVGYENRAIADEDFRDDAVDAGEVGSGHTVTALYELVLRDRRGDRDLANMRLRAKPPGPDRPAEEWRTPLRAPAVHTTFDAASGDLKMAFVAAELAQKLKGSPHAAETSWPALLALGARADRGLDADRDLLETLHRAAALGDPRGEALTSATRER